MSVRGKDAGDLAGTRRNILSRNWALFLCLGCFYAGMFFTNRMWMVPERRNTPRTSEAVDKRLKLRSEGCSMKVVRKHTSNDSLEEVSETEHAMLMLNKTVSYLEMKLAAAKMVRESVQNSNSISGNWKTLESTLKRKYFMVTGISTAFSSRKRTDSVRMTGCHKKVNLRSGKVYSSESHQSETLNRKKYFSCNQPANKTSLTHHSKPRVYIGCMKSGPVLARKGVRYHEPEYWKFGTSGNKYFRHATGQLYVVSKELATYISINQHVLHKYVNEDVSVASWFIGLDVEYENDRRLCCGTPPDCEWKAQAGNMCAASFDWQCSGICSSVERMVDVHQCCGEDENALWSESF